MGYLIAIVLGFIISLFILLPFIFRKSIGHDIFGWHKVEEATETHGINLHGKCVYCGKDCIMDSQGNWF